MTKEETLATEPDKPPRCTAFCEICGHGVLSVKSHIQAEEHKRNLRRQDGKLRRRRPKIPINVGTARIIRGEKDAGLD